MFHRTLALALVASTLSVAALAQTCSQKHFKGGERLARSIKSGDVKILRGIAGHTVRNALEHYDIEDLVTEADLTRAAKGMEYFLKWKLGSPTLVTGQWVTAGYAHFEKAYRDEAAGMLMGVFELSQNEPELRLPEFMLVWVENQVGQSDEAIAAFLVSQGIPQIIAGPLAKKAEEALQNLIERNKAGVFVPKSFDIKNEIVETAIRARRELPRSSPFGLPGKGGQGNGGSGGGIPPVVIGRLPREFPGRGQPDQAPNGPVPPQSDPQTPTTMEQRVADLESRVARLEQLLGAAAVLLEKREQTTAALSDAKVGYEKLKMNLWTYGQGRCSVSVNGMLVGLYDSDATLDLTPFLQSGKENVVSFKSELNKGGDPNRLVVYLTGTMPDAKSSVRFYKFQGSKDRMGDSIEVAIAPGAAR